MVHRRSAYARTIARSPARGGGATATIDRPGPRQYGPPSLFGASGAGLVYGRKAGLVVMKIVNSLKTLKTRHRDCRVIRRRGRVYVINKTQRRYKARQG